MSEDTNTTTADNASAEVKTKVIPDISVTRSEVTLTYTETELLRGDNEGWKYPQLVITAENLLDVIKHLGSEIVVDKLNAIMRVNAQNWWKAAIKEATDTVTGILDIPKATGLFNKLATDLSARGDSIPELKKQIDELVNEITGADPTQEGYKVFVTGRASKIKVLQAAIAANRRDPKKKDGDKDESEDTKE